MKLSKYGRAALLAAKNGAAVLLKYYGKTLNVAYKGATDPVSQADRNSQKTIINTIKNFFPEHGVLAEEDGVNEAKKDFCWIIDPLDGTVNFVHGVPMFCVSVALRHKGEIIAGVIYSPVMKEVFAAEKGRGAFLNGKKIKVSNTNTLIRSLAVTGFPYDLGKRRGKIIENFANLVPECQGIRRLGSAALDMAYVACGRFEFFWEETLKPWDIAAGIVIVEEAGGIVTDYKGGKDYFSNSTLLASNGTAVHKSVLRILK